MIDTRIEGRDQEVPTSDPAIDDPNRTILGDVQMQWLKDQLGNSTAQWKIIGNQVMFAPLELPAIPIIFPQGGIINADQWDGYRADREELVEYIHDNDIDNTVVLTGDIHTSWGNDIPHHDLNYDPNNGQGSVGVEYVVTSITSGSSPISIGTEIISAANPHMKYIDLAQKGYLILDVNTEYTEGNWVYVSAVDQQNFTVSEPDGWLTFNGQNFLRPESTLGVANPTPMSSTLQLEVYPNPTSGDLTLKIGSSGTAVLSCTLYDVMGKELRTEALGKISNGKMSRSLATSYLSEGLYMIKLINEKGEAVSKLFIKN
jgi:alkaline phosphatase D